MFKEIPVNNYSSAKKKLVQGVGVNDSPYMTIYRSGGVSYRCQFYIKWKDMLNRCYSSSFHLKRPTYKGCTVCPEWLVFSNFKLWMEKQNWKGQHLDKDLVISDNKEYSPRSCLFVSSHVNSVLHENKKTRGKYPMGVSFHKASNKYVVNISANGASEYLGVFGLMSQAQVAYLKRKVEIISKLACEQSNKNVESALLVKIDEYKLKLEELKNGE